jgi:small subunit ribosomal protein S21
MIKVAVKENESIDKALKRFKKKLERSGVLKQYRQNQFFSKPSVVKRNVYSRAVLRQRYLDQFK